MIGLMPSEYTQLLFCVTYGLFLIIRALFFFWPVENSLDAVLTKRLLRIASTFSFSPVAKPSIDL